MGGPAYHATAYVRAFIVRFSALINGDAVNNTQAVTAGFAALSASNPRMSWRGLPSE